MTIWPLYFYILRAAVRDRLFLSIGVLLVVIISLSIFFGSSALAEREQFARVFAAFGFRLFGTFGLVVFIISYIRRCFESRDIDYLLSRPIGRVPFILMHAAAFSSIALIVAFILGGTTVVLEAGGYHSGVFLWWFSVAAEFVIMANVAMFFAFVMTSSTACMLIVFAFYLLSRLIGEILGIIAKPGIEGIQMYLGKTMEVISIFIPRLDLMGQTKWLLYKDAAEISFGFVSAQCLIFVALIIAATAIDMKRRQF